MAQAYDIDDSISSFFETRTSVSRQKCDDFVTSRFKTPARPVQTQGVWSYTVTAGDSNSTIIQFRAFDSPLELSKMDLVKRAACGFVADVTYHGTIGADRPLHIYEMKKLPGEVFITAVSHYIQHAEGKQSQRQNTIQDLAR